MKLRTILVSFCFIISAQGLEAQVDSIFSRIDFETDFRFRIEQDWDSRKSDGSYRDDRTRLRYRLRTGATYTQDSYSLGFRIRTGDPNKQQDPQLTLGKGLEEFGTLPIGFEKVFFKGNHKHFKYWLGKNDFSFDRNNELFWSDNVFPEGIFIQQDIPLKSDLVESINIKGGHYIISSNGKSFNTDAYVQGLQTTVTLKNKMLTFFPSIYLFRNIPDIPDGGHSFELDYSIFHLGLKLNPLSSKNLFIEFDLYQNLEDYSSLTGVTEDFKDERSGYIIGVQYGAFQNPKDWKIKMTFTSLQKFAALDYVAQNDWARWDYSSFNSPDGRLTNFNGAEIVLGYKLNSKANLIAKYYVVSQIVPNGLFKETGQRIRFDLNVKM